MRRTVILAHKLTEPEKPPSGPQNRDRTAARKRIIREVEDTIQRKTKGDEAERLHAEFVERLDAPDLDDDIAHRPVAGIIKDICRDLGVEDLPGAHPWKRRTPADIAILAARAAATISAEARASQPPNIPDPAHVAPRPPHQQTPISTSTGPP
jgi:hypothetical protein